MVSNLEMPKQGKFILSPFLAKTRKIHSQPISYIDADGKSRIDRLKDKWFDSFKIWYGKLEKQFSFLRGKQQVSEPQVNTSPSTGIEPLPVARYFDALERPELDTLRVSEELVLPEYKQWPFLLCYPISSFGICLGICSQAILWKTIATSTSTRFLHISLDINFVLWYIFVALTATVFFIYSLKTIFYFEAIRRAQQKILFLEHCQRKPY